MYRDEAEGGIRLRLLLAKAETRAYSLWDWDGEDLFQDTLTWALETPRWPVDIPFDAFVHMRMRQLASDRLKSQRQLIGHRSNQISLYGSQSDDALNENLENLKRVEAVFKILSGDDLAINVLVGLWRGDTASDIKQSLDLDDREYDTVRRRIRRRLDNINRA